MVPQEYFKGINVHAPESRDHADELVEFLQGTPIEWVRIHPLPSRRLRAKNSEGKSFLDAIVKFARAGFNLVLPIDVGVRDNVGIVTGAHLRKFVDESYTASYKAVKQIETRLSKYNVEVIYGVENEIDTKEWILQSMPAVRWRETTMAWLALSVNAHLKYKRLRNILDGIRDASPGSRTMVNFEADDPKDDWTTTMSFIVAAQKISARLGLLKSQAALRMNNYRVDIVNALEHLDVDLIGIDNYPNYFTKFPPRGEEIGLKVDEISKWTDKPVINVEFGYSSRNPRSIFTSLMSELGRASHKETRSLRTSGGEAQEMFFKNALASIKDSKSCGTFPWVLYLDPMRAYRPDAENGFTLLERGLSKRFEPAPALRYYLEWLEDDVQVFPESGQPAHVKTK